MHSGHWRSDLFPRPAEPGLASWLSEPDSLTRRCERACRQFRVRLLRQGVALPLADDVGLPGLRAGQFAKVREVVLECDGVPVIFAHTVLAPGRRGRLNRWLGGLGNRSLGSLLFAHPGFQRTPIQFCRLDPRHPLFRRAAAAADVAGMRHLWARRSAHALDGQTVLVNEVFLPGIAGLEAAGAAR